MKAVRYIVITLSIYTSQTEPSMRRTSSFSAPANTRTFFSTSSLRPMWHPQWSSWKNQFWLDPSMQTILRYQDMYQKFTNHPFNTRIWEPIYIGHKAPTVGQSLPDYVKELKNWWTHDKVAAFNSTFHRNYLNWDSGASGYELEQNEELIDDYLQAYKAYQANPTSQQRQLDLQEQQTELMLLLYPDIILN